MKKVKKAKKKSDNADYDGSTKKIEPAFLVSGNYNYS